MALTDFFKAASAQAPAPGAPPAGPPVPAQSGRTENYGGSGQQSGAGDNLGPQEGGDLRGYHDNFGDDTINTLGQIKGPSFLPDANEYSLPEAIAMGATVLTEVAAGLAICFLIWGALNFSMAAGDEERVEHAKDIMRWSIIGLIVALMSFGIVYMVSSAIGTGA